MAASTAAVEIIYLQRLLKNMAFAPEEYTPVYEWSNNVLGGRERAEHLDLRKHFAHDAMQNGRLLPCA